MTRVGLLLAISQIFVLSAHGYQYLGCYLDDADRDLSQRVEGSWTSPSKCNQLCAGKGFPFFGLQASSECWCSGWYGKYGPAREQECNKKCSSSDDNNAMCGSDWRNSLYASDNIDNGEKQRMRFIGCFADANNRDFPVLILRGVAMTLDFCHAHCKARQFTHFAVQAGHECYCGNNYGRYGIRNVDECRNDCRGDRSQYCGGEWRNSVYSIVYEPTEVKESMHLEVRNELTAMINTLSAPYSPNVICPSCLISAWNKRVVDMKFRRFTMNDMASVLSSYPEKIREKVLRLHHGSNARTTFEDIDVVLISGIITGRKLTIGVAKRDKDNVELWTISADLIAYPVPKQETFIDRGRIIARIRGYHADELALIDKALRYETYKLLDEKLKSFK